MPLPVIIRPGYIVRRSAMRKGLLGPSKVWKVIAFAVFGVDVFRRLFGSPPKVVGRSMIDAGHLLSVAVTVPLSRKEARRAGISKASLEAAARADIEAAQRAS